VQHWRLEGTSSMPAPKLQYIIGLPQQSRCGYEASVQSTLCRHRCGVSVLALLCAGVEEEYLCQTYYKPAQIVGIWISKPKQQNNIFFLILEGNSWATLTSNIFFTSNVCGVQPSKCDISCPHWIPPYYMVLPMCHYYAQYGVLLLFTLAVKSFVQLFRHHNSFKENKSYY